MVYNINIKFREIIMKDIKYDLTKREDIEALIKFLEAEDGYTLTTTENRDELLEKIREHNNDVFASRQESPYDLTTAEGRRTLIDDVVKHSQEVLKKKQAQELKQDRAEKKKQYDLTTRAGINELFADVVEKNKEIFERRGITPPKQEITPKNDYRKERYWNTSKGKSEIQVLRP